MRRIRLMKVSLRLKKLTLKIFKFESKLLEWAAIVIKAWTINLF